MPSTTSSSFSRPEPSSTVITPSLPTFSIASAIFLPIASSLFAEIVPTWAMAFESLQGFESFLSSSTVAFTARSTPRLTSIGLMPEATAFMPSRMIACASRVAVVVPSPASSEVEDTTSFTICAPMFSNLSFSSISLATETPSLVTVGAPKLFSSTALRPFGPSVALTAFASRLTPRTMRVRASSEKRTSLAAMIACSSGLLFDDGHDVFLAHHEEVFAVDLDFGSAVLAEQDLVADLDVERTDLAVFQDLALADRDDLAADGLLGSGVGNDDPAGGFALFVFALDDHTIMKRTDLHGSTLLGNSLALGLDGC